MNKLKSCPFCGRRDIEFQFGIPNKEGFPANVICKNCAACGPWLYIPDVDCEALALREWNKRTDEWISIEDGMPDIRVSVLCWVECTSCRKGIPHAHMAIERPYPFPGTYIDWLVDYETKELKEKGIISYRDVKIEPKWHYGSEANITHWMHIPQPPEIL